MVLQTPPPPSITPRQMNLLRIVSYMAWSDGGLAEEEADLMLNRFSRIFSDDVNQQQQLKHELQDYLMQNIPLQELVPKLQNQADRELVLRLGYEVIRSSARTPEEDNINEEEAAAYQTLKHLLNLPSEDVERIESEVEATGTNDESIVDTLTRELQDYVDR